MNEDTVMIADSVPEESVLYAVIEEGDGDVEKRDSFMARRNQLMERINEEDKMHNALVAYKEEQSRKTQELVRQRRRARELEERRLEGLRRANENRRAAAKAPELTAEQMHEKALAEVFDEPKSKLRKRRVKAEAPKGVVSVEADGRSEEKTEGDEEK